VLLLVAAGAAFAANPAVLVCSPMGAAYGYVDLDYLQELKQAGFEVDFTDSLRDVTWDRLKQYNAVVVYMEPDALQYPPPTPPSAQNDQFVKDLIRYAEAGGGVWLWPGENDMYKQSLWDLTEHWGAKLPGEIIVENDKANQGVLTHSNQATELAYTDQVKPSPVTAGITGIWYPLRPAYNGGMGGPLFVDQNWQVVLTALPTALTKAVDTSKSTSAIPGLMVRPEGVPAPPLMATRTAGAGRVALINQWVQFSMGSGTKWIYDRQVLDKGCQNKPSDFGKLIQNTLRWLAEPSLASGAVGGFTTPADRLQPPNASAAVKKDYLEKTVPYDVKTLGTVTIPDNLKLYRGLLGAKSAYSSGTGTVAEYAAAARQAGLDFVIFMEDFNKLTPQKLEQLKQDCIANSDAKLLLLPGFCMPNNLGNHMFFYSPNPVWPPDLVLTGPDKGTLYIQEEDGKGKFTGYLTPYLDWVLGAYHVEKGQVGYYNFSDSPKGMRIHDLRLYAMAGVRYYRGGKLIEDNTPDYLTTAQCTIAPAPASVNEVYSPQELIREAASGHALMYGTAYSLDATAPTGAFMRFLRWTHQYDGISFFSSDGPKIMSWADCYRVWTYGGEPFVRGNAVMYSPLYVTSDQGLRSISIYNGDALYRRFSCNGEKEFKQTLVLDGTVHKNLVLIAEDLRGGKAISFPRRCWYDGALAPSFCSDHVNDGNMFLAHGPYGLPLNNLPALPYNMAGDTWDGGPAAALPLGYEGTLSTLEATDGTEDSGRLDLIPLLEFSDEGAVAVQTVRNEKYDDRILTVVNPWHTYGPIDGPPEYFTMIQRYRQWVPPTIGVPNTGWAAPGVRYGIMPSIINNEFKFLKATPVKSMILAYTVRREWNVVFFRESGPQVVDMAAGYDTYPLKHGEWLGLAPKSGLGNLQLFCNRGADLVIKMTGYMEFHPDFEGKTLPAGAVYNFELAGYGFPVDMTVTKPQELSKWVDYMKAPAGMQILRGSRSANPGLLDLTPGNYAVELEIPRPADKLNLTVPVRIEGLNPRWSAGLFQVTGYSKGFYGNGQNRYRMLGLDLKGVAYLPLYVDLAPTTHILAGHPIVAGPEGQELFIQVTNVGDTPDKWHLSVNNPTDKPITTRLQQAMQLPGLAFPERRITLQPGEYKVLQ
jgi:hypothetical protein